RRCDGGTPGLRDARRGLGGHAAPQRSVGFKGAGFLLLEHARTWWTSLVGAPNRAADSHGRDMSESRVHREISLRGNSPLSEASMVGPMRPDGDRGRENFSTFSRTKSSG